MIQGPENPLSAKVVRNYLRPAIPVFERGATTLIEHLRSGNGVPAAEQDVKVIEESTEPMDRWALMLTAFDDIAEVERVQAVDKFVKYIATIQRIETAQPRVVRSAFRQNRSSGLREFFARISLDDGKLPRDSEEPRVELDFIGMLMSDPETLRDRIAAESLRARPERIVIRMEEERGGRPVFTQSLSVRAEAVTFSKRLGKPRGHNLAGITIGSNPDSDHVWGFGTMYIGDKAFHSEASWRTSLQDEEFNHIFGSVGRLVIVDSSRGINLR